MMTIESIVNDIVLLKLSDPEPLAELGIEQTAIYSKVTGYDQYGVWIEHPRFQIPCPPNKKDGKPTTETVVANLQIPWTLIISIVHFPGVEGFDFPDPFETPPIGFEIQTPKSTEKKKS